MQYKMYKKEYKKKPMGSKTLLMKGTVHRDEEDTLGLYNIHSFIRHVFTTHFYVLGIVLAMTRTWFLPQKLPG